jgi:transketolase
MEQELASLQLEAKETGTSPELLAEIKQLKAELADIKKDKEAKSQEAQAKAQAEQAWNQQVAEFEENYPDIDLPKLAANKDFLEYLEGANPNLTISQNYERFLKFFGKANADAVAKLKSNIDRSTSSGRAKGDASGGTYGLSVDEQELAVENGMTYKEYAERKRK